MKKIFLLLVLMGLFIGCSDSDDSGTPPETPGTSNPSPTPTPDPNVDRSGNLLATGASANDLLSNTNFDRIRIEIGHVAGFQPTPTTISNFQAFIEQHSFKQEIEVVLSPLSSPEEETLTLQEIDDLEQANRTAYNDGSTLAVYIYFADAPSDDDDEEEDLVTLGAVFRNTSMVIFESTIRNLAARANGISLTDIETATLNHEFGHLFGLVNLGTVPVNDHEDVDAPNHCNVDGCLMQAQLQFGSPAARRFLATSSKEGVLSSPCTLSGYSMIKLLERRTANGMAIVPILDDECILDLQSNGGR